MKTIFRGKIKEGSFVAIPPFKTVQTLKFTYDFTRDGGAAGSIAMKDELGRAMKIPDNAVILAVRQESVVDCTSGGAATIALGYTASTAAFLSATAFSDASFDVDAVSARTANVKTAAAVDCLVTIAAAALTAGRFNLYLDYVEGD